MSEEPRPVLWDVEEELKAWAEKPPSCVGAAAAWGKKVEHSALRVSVAKERRGSLKRKQRMVSAGRKKRQRPCHSLPGEKKL
jgi:hypothetical protein